MALSSILAGLTILIIGDSHLATPTYLMSSLHSDLVQQGAKVHSIGVCGIQPADWTTTKPGNCGGAERIGAARAVTMGGNARTTPVAQLIAAEKPNLVVVVMGDTTAGYKDDDFPMAWAWQQVTTLSRAIGATGTACAWVGPAWGRAGGPFGKNDGRVKIMAKFLSVNVTPCTFIDSLKMSSPGKWPTVDGQHFTPSGYNAWGHAISKTIVNLPAVRNARH